MPSFAFCLALSALAVASPLAPRQDIDRDIVDANPAPSFSQAVGVTAQVVAYPTAAIQADATDVSSLTVDVTDVASPTQSDTIEKRGASCAAQPTGATGAPSYSPDNAQAFASQTSFGDIASAAPTPSGYSQTFSNLAASNNAYGYLGFVTLQTYDTNACAAKCNKINGCLAINLYFERDPSKDPGSGCENPPSYTMIKCVFWGGPVDSINAVNTGQWRSKFQVAIAGSNGYISNAILTPPGYTAPRYLGAAAINAPYDSQGFNSYMGSNVFPPGPFNIQLCADFCSAQSKYNRAQPPTDGSPVQTCQFFNTYLIYINTTSQVQGQYCAIYSEAWGPSYATNVGQWRGNNHYLIQYSFTGTNSSDPGTPNKNSAIYQARKDINWAGNNAQPYCSSLLGYTTPVTTTTTIFAITPSSTVTSTTTVSTTVTLNVRRNEVELEARTPSVPVPDVLTKYPVTVITSACVLAISSPTSTSTVVVTTTATASPVINTAIVTVTSIATATVTTSPPLPACTPDQNNPDDYYVSTQCDTTVDAGWALVEAPYTVADFAECVDLARTGDYTAAVTFESRTKLCSQWSVSGGKSTVKAAAGIVFGYYNFLVSYGTLSLST